jgi:hypothetical protein
MRAFLLALVMAALSGHAWADECRPMADALKAHPEIVEGKPVKGAQFWLLAGMYFSAPNTPAELPQGDRAIAIDKGDDLTIVMFMTAWPATRSS